MSTPSSSTRPAISALGMTSCIRLRMRRKVDFPQPDGPINAVTRLAAICRLQRSSTLRLPNHALSATASSVLDCRRPVGPPSIGAGRRDLMCRVAGAHAHRALPSFRCPLLATTRAVTNSTRTSSTRTRGPVHARWFCVSSGTRIQLPDEQRQVRLRAVEWVGVGRVGAEGGQQHRRGLTDRSGDAQDDRRDQADARGRDDHAHHDPPLGRAQRQRRLTERVGDGAQDLLGRPGDGRKHQHHQARRTRRGRRSHDRSPRP